MGAFAVVVRDEFCQHRSKLLLVQHDHVVQTFAAECPDHSLDDGVRPRCPNGCGDAVDTHPSGPLAEVAAVHRVPITQQMPRLVAQGVASIS